MAQLGDSDGPLDSGTGTVQHPCDIPELQSRHHAAARMFHLAAVQAEGPARRGQAPDVQPIHVQLSL